ncbi:acetate kinase [Lysobacter humi (ex Lee et al. 2017)]
MSRWTPRLALAAAIALALAGPVQADEASRLDQLEKLVQQQAAQLESMRETLAAQEREVGALREALQAERLDDLRGQGATSSAAPVALGPTPVAGAMLPSSAGAVGAAPGALPATTMQAASAAAGAQDAQQPVGQAPEERIRPQVAQIFQQPGVLTPPGRFVLEPSVQLGYSSTDRVALVGYTVIPAILIGLIDVRQVKTTSTTVSLAGRYGLTNRMELEARVPYVHLNSDTVSREIFTGSAQDKVFNASGKGLGDVEVTARYQLNRGGIDKPFYVGWLRYKSRTGKDPFEVVTDCVTRCVANATGTGLPLELPTGSGFEALQAGVTWLFASDPVVFFGTLSYLHNFERNNVSRTVLTGAPEPNPQTTTDPIGNIKAGDIVGFNLGMGLALNEKAAISIGYDHSLIGRTESNGQPLPGAVRVQLGTLLLGGSYRLSDRMSLNVSLGVGVTRDTPDTSLMVRVPVTF